MSGCYFPHGAGSPPILFFSITEDTPTSNLVGAGAVDVLTLGVSPPGPGQHQVKLDSTVEINIAKPAGTTLTYNIECLLQKNGSSIAVWNESGNFSVSNAASNYSITSSMTWNDLITNSVTYTLEIQVITITPAGSNITAETRALSAVVF